jgi:hypothetical protein
VTVTGGVHDAVMADAPVATIDPQSTRFAAAVRAVSDEARRLGLDVPVFRSPPRVAGVDRTVRSRRGELVVAVRLAGRPFADIVADVVAGVLVANAVPLGPDLAVRRRLIEAVEPLVGGTFNDRSR